MEQSSEEYYADEEAMRPIITSTHAEAELFIMRETEKKIAYQEQCALFAQCEIERLRRQQEWSKDRLKTYAEQVGFKTVKMNGGTLKFREQDVYTYPESNEDIVKFLKEYPEFKLVKTIERIDKNEVKNYIKTKGHIPGSCDVKSVTNFNVSLKQEIAKVDNF